MTREETRKIAEVLMAYSEGKVILAKAKGIDMPWAEILTEHDFDIRNNEYRIKPEFKLRPYKNADEFMKANKEHGLFLIINNRFVMPVSVTDNSIFYIDTSCDSLVQRFTMRGLKDHIIWQDGAPCGVMEEGEA